jgi:DNA replication and repair protein RecF
VGKTNLLDAIYYLSFTKSYFNSIDTQNIRHGEEFFAIHGTFQRNGGLPEQVSCIQKLGAKKQFKLNQKEYDRMSDHIGTFPCVMVSPYDRDLNQRSSEVRRKFIDAVISQFDKVYLDDLIRYQPPAGTAEFAAEEICRQSVVDRSMLLLLDEQMSAPAKQFFRKTTAVPRRFPAHLQPLFEFISGGQEKVDILTIRGCWKVIISTWL